ncbi:MAG TPA: Hsp20/alpha crystallin family protein [Rhodanobacter sp.]|nr:Hsp20/alpha crystallin family protein [Rhodanobacter sp.]
MATMTRWNPLRAVSRMDPLANFEDMFRDLGTRPLWRELEATTPDMRIDVTENDKAFLVNAEMPGIDKNDIAISVEGNQVSISAEVKRESKKKDNEMDVYTERYYGKVFRSFSLPTEIESTKADAHYDNGILHLTLPKKHNGGAHKITVS